MAKAAAAALAKPPKHDPDSVVLPHNLDAERSLLGAAMMHEAQADYIADRLTPEAFYRRAHRLIFEGLRDLRHKGRGVDLTLLREQLGKKKLEEVGGAVYLMTLTDGIPRGTNVAHYIDVVKDLHAKRSLFEFARTTLDYVAAGEHGATSLLEDADRRLIELTGGHVKGRVQAIGETVNDLLDDLEYRVAHRGELVGLDTGYASINELTSGWQVGDLTVIGARPSIGKTTLLLNTAAAVAKALVAAKRTEAVLLFSFEMRRRQLEYRLLSCLAGVPLTRIIGGTIMSHEWPALTAALELMRELPIEIDDRAGQTRWQIRSTCRRVKAERGLALVGIDYVQLIPGSLERKGATRNEEITDISRGTKELADEIAAPILLLSQLSRPGKFGGKDPRPKLTDLRESGALEQDADNVGFLHRRNHREGGVTEFILEKQRNGPTGTVRLTLDRDVVTFTDGGEEEPAPESAKPKKKVDPPLERHFTN